MASEATIHDPDQRPARFSLPTVAFQGLPSTLCKGCGHNSITSHLIEACKSVGVNPYYTVKFSGIGCSSKTPAYFLQYSHGFNALHGRMPSVATGAAARQPASSLCIGISGDGDTANIGLGQFKHACRRNLPLVYIIENNGCYGLTKGQFSATADLHAHLRRETGEENTVPPFDLCLEAIVGGAIVRRPVVRRRQEAARPPAQGGPASTRGSSVLDIISPCVTFNDFAGSTKSWDWAKEHEEPLQEVGFVRRLPEIEVEQKAGETDPRPAPRRLVDRPPRPAATTSTTSPTAARRMRLLDREPGARRVPHRPDLRRPRAARLRRHAGHDRHPAGPPRRRDPAALARRCSTKIMETI